jgi:hypothetical protein
MMWKLAIALVLLVSSAHASHETFGPLAQMLPTGTDRGGWSFNYTDTGYLMANNMPNNERSLRCFTVPEMAIRAYQRPFTYSVKIYIRPNKQFIHPEFGANAGLVYAVDPKNPKWQVIMVRADGSVMTASFTPRENRGAGQFVPRENRGAGQLSNQLFYMQTGAEAGKATEIKVVESEQGAVVSINGQPLIQVTVPPYGSVGLIACGSGEYHFREFTILDKQGEKVPGRQRRPNVLR